MPGAGIYLGAGNNLTIKERIDAWCKNILINLTFKESIDARCRNLLFSLTIKERIDARCRNRILVVKDITFYYLNDLLVIYLSCVR